jgi:hypothetical protein
VIEFKAYRDGEEVQIMEVSAIDSADPSCDAFTVYVEAPEETP